jgi:glutathione synthase/RimK-type ligase-like ATP-grasp enzyme
MAEDHWQIINYENSGDEGAFTTLAVEDAPAEVVKTALKAANLIGDGLYGVDLKQTSKGVVVIEVNDNPSIDAGVEDKALGPELYRAIMGEFLRRLELKRQGQTPAP